MCNKQTHVNHNKINQGHMTNLKQYKVLKWIPKYQIETRQEVMPQELQDFGYVV